MSDLISRQAAIDALHMHLMYRMGTDSNKKRLDDWINGLPSAQETHEERTETHACDLISRQAAIDAIDKRVQFLKDDPVFRRKHGDIDLYGIKPIIRALPSAQPEQRWIPCSERLPEKEVVYIITVHYDDRNFITFDNFCSYKHGWKEWSNQEVLAWMPLPEAYREEK